MDVKSIAALLSLSIASLSSQEYTVDCSVTYNDWYSVGKTVYEPTEKDLVSPIRVKFSFPTSDTSSFPKSSNVALSFPHDKRPESLLQVESVFVDSTTASCVPVCAPTMRGVI